MSRDYPPDVKIIGDGKDVFVIVDGQTIAKRGRPDTPEAKTWIALAPGWLVEGDAVLRITHNAEVLH